MRHRILSLSALVLISTLPNLASACACGCGVFDVGTGTMLPTGTGGTAWLEYDFLNQYINWSGSSVAPEANNDDKRIRSDFYTAGFEYMFNRSWGAMIEVPYTNRYFRTTDDAGNLTSAERGGLGDIRIEGIYSGFSADMSSGITYGVKLATGDHSFTGFDRDTSIGTGSTDLLLGGYHMGRITSDNKLSWFADGRFDQPVLIQNQYRPGDELDAAAGMYYDAGPVAGLGKLSPLLQLLVSQRWRDSGAEADATDSGYSRLLVSPGVEYDLNSLRLYGDVEVPVYQHVNGNQLVPAAMFKFIVAYNF